MVCLDRSGYECEFAYDTRRPTASRESDEPSPTLFYVDKATYIRD